MHLDLSERLYNSISVSHAYITEYTWLAPQTLL